MLSKNPKARILALFLGLLMLSNQLLANVNVLIIGSSKDSGEMHNSGVSWNAQKPAYTPNSKPFSPAEIRTQLQNILAQDGRGTVNVTLVDRYRMDAITELAGWSAHSYTLAGWFHHPYPVGAETARWANLRGAAGTVWDYVVLIGDPYTMEYTPGMYAHGVAKIAEEVAKGPAQLILLMPWPGSGSSATVNHYKEVVYRAGRSGGHKVAPAALAWQACGSPVTNGSHPNAAGAYIAAASIYSSIYNQSAAASGYVSSDANANTTFTTYTNNNSASQYTGNLSFQNPYKILDDKRRGIRMSERGTSTEDGFKAKLKPAMDRCKVTYAEYNDGTYVNNIPPAWATSPLPIDFNYGRDGFYSEDFKSYLANPSYWQLGFGYYYQNSTAAYTVETANDIFIGLMQEQDNDLANRMLNEAPTARNMPTRSLWAQIHKEYPTLNPMRDSQHLSYNWDEAVGTYIYTLFSGRCPLDPKPATDDIVWTCRKIGYETAWRLGRCQSRVPGFKVTPSAASKKSIIPGEKETMKVEFILPPQQDVTVNVSISNTNAAVVGSQQLVFTPQNYNIPQNVTVAGLAGSAASDTFNVAFTTVSTDEVCNGLSDTWDYTITRSAPVTLTRVNKATNLVTAYQNLPVTVNLNTAGAISTNTVLAGPSRGTTTWSGSSVIYTPSSDFLGKDGFSFATNDGTTLSVGYVEITVTAAAVNGMVSYRGNGSETGTVPVDSATYAQNATVTVLGNTGNLARVGYNFAGWNTAANGSGTNYAGGATFPMGASGMILYAKWTAVPTYTVTYHGNSNTSGSVPFNQIKTDGINLTLATNIGTLARTNYNFAGWNTATDGTGTDYAVGAVYSGNAILTLYAKWTPVTYAVNYNANTATSGTAPANQTKTFGVNLTLQTNSGNLARTGYTFAGWNTQADGLGTNYAPGATYTANAALTLYAKWTAVTSYTVSYHANGATSGTVPADQTKQIDVALTLATNTGVLARTGYTFAGWNTATDGTGTPYAVGASYTANAAVILYAQWAGAATYTISYNGNGNTGGTAPSNQTKNQGVALALATNSGNLTKTGFTFMGWNTATNGGGTSYAVGATYTADAALALYAQWNALPVVNAGANQTVTLSAGTPWSPSSLAPQLWLDADDTNTITLNGGTVSQWADKSGFARHATALTTAQPTATAAGLNGKRVLTFDGGTDVLDVNLDFMAGVSHSAFIVTKPTIYSNIYGAATGNAGANSLHVGFASATTYRMNYWGNDYGPAVTANFVAGSANIMNYVWTSGTSKQILANGKSEGISTSPVPGTIGTMSGGGRIGRTTGNAFFGGDIAEFIAVTGAVSATDREKMEGYLAHKWGLAGNLAAGHPYKSAAPGGSSAVATIDATATDADTMTTTWTVVSGPASVTFANAAAIDTTATFTVAGVYTLRLTANDGYGAVSSDIVITVNAAGSTHSVTYNGNGNTGGTAPVDASSPYTNAATVTVLGNTGALVRTGYTFNNWNTAANGSGTSYATAATFSISTPTTLYAQWTANTYAVTYNANSATSGTIPAAQTKTQDVNLTLQNNTGTLARTGYTFTGWNTQADGLGTDHAAAGIYTTNAVATLYAKWTINTYAVTYNANSATSGTAPAAQTKTHDVSLTLQTNTGILARTGYTFAGWNTQADGLGTSYAVASAYTANSVVTLYAKWTASSYAVTYNANSATSGTIPAAQTKTHDVSLTLQNNTGTLARTGYTFAGWNTQDDGLGTSYAVASAYTANVAVTLYAKWTPNTYVVSYLGNGNTSGTVPANQSKIHDVNLTLATNSGSLAKTGYTFTGWNTAANGLGTAYAIGAAYSANLGVTLYAQWSLGTFLTWDANGTGVGQTNGGGAWEGANLWWNGTGNSNWIVGASTTFGGPNTAGGAVTLAAPTTVENLTFNQFTGTYTLGTAAQTLTINTGMTMNASAGAVTFSSPITLGGPQTWTNNSANALTINAALGNGGHTLTVDGSGFTNFTTALAAGAGGITKNGSGRLQLNNAAQLYTGPTIVNGGVLSYGDNSSYLSAANITLNGGVIDQRWTADFTRALGSGSNQIQITGGASGFSNNNGSHTVTINNNAATEMVWGAANEAGNALATGFFNPSTFVLQSAFSQGANTLTFSNNIDLNGTTRTIQANSGVSGTSISTLSGVIRTSSGTAGMIKTGGGLLILNGANTYNGDTTINGGVLRIGSATAGTLGNGSYSGNISIVSGSTLQIWSSAAQTLSGVISGAGGLHKAYGGTLALSGPNTYTGRTSFLPQSTNGFTVNIASFNSVNGGTPLMASSSLGAPTTIANGTIDVGDGTKQAGVNLTYNGPGETTDRVINFGFNGGSSQTLAASGSGLLKFTSAMTANTITTQSGSLILRGTGSGEITQALPALPSGGLSKNDGGTWTLGGANAYTGPTAITAGKLFLNGDQSLATGAVTVSASATLGGTGTIGGNTTIAANGILEFNLSTAAGSHDKLDFAATRTLVFSGASTLTITNTGGASPGSYTLLTAPGGITGSLPTLSLPVDWAATVSIVGNDLVLNVTSTSSGYPVTYNSNSATSGTAPSNQTKIHGVSLPLAFNTGTLARTGYTFAGWNTLATGLGTDYTEGAAYTTNAILTLYAKWTMLPYTSWASSSGLSGGNAASTANPDGDNLTNLQEFAFGMNPNSPLLSPLSYVANGSTTGGTPVLEKQGPTYRAVFARRKDHAAAGITYTVSFSADLASWTASATSPTRLSGDNADTMEAVSIDFPATVPLQAGGNAAPKFFRVAVAGN